MALASRAGQERKTENLADTYKGNVSFIFLANFVKLKGRDAGGKGREAVTLWLTTSKGGKGRDAEVRDMEKEEEKTERANKPRERY